MLKFNAKRLTGFLFASSLGTYLEFFDIALYSFASAIIAKRFFPAGNPSVATLATWGIFAVSYLMRPLGAICFGYLADMRSSRMAMVISMSMMAVATAGIGLLPTYAEIGFMAPVLLLMLRIMQSIAVSPEYNLPSVYIKNNQWCKNNFGLVSSITAFVTGLGTMSASWIMARIMFNYDVNTVPEYLWRLPFIVAGILVGTIGIYLRLSLDDSLNTVRPKTVPFKLVIKNQAKDFIFAVFIAGYVGCISYALFGFLVHQLQSVRALSTGDALAVLGKGTLLPACFSLLAGYLSDRVIRNGLMLISALVMGASGYYLFNNLGLMSHGTLVLHTCIMLAGLGFFAGSFPGYLAELFAQEYRYTGAFLAYNMGMSWIGGISPLLFIKVSTINSSLPAVIIVTYSALIIALVARPVTSIFTAKTPQIV